MLQSVPSTVNLTLYSSETINTPTASPALQQIVNQVEAGNYRPNIHQVFPFSDLPSAQEIMEQNLAAGKLVVSI